MGITLPTPGSFLAAVPALVGHLPTDSLVIVAQQNDSHGCPCVGVVLRLDLEDLFEDITGACAALATLLMRHPTTAISGVVIAPPTRHADLDDPVAPGSLPFHSRQVQIASSLRERGISTQQWFYLPHFQTGARWDSYDDPALHGELPDINSHPLTLELALLDQPIAESRETLVARFALRATSVRDRLREPIESAVRATRTVESVSDTVRSYTARLDAALAAAADRQLPTSDEDIAELAAATTIPMVRDMFVGLAPERARSADLLWLHLWAHSPEPTASAVAELIFANAYLIGDGVWARIASDHIHYPSALAGLFRRALFSGTSPATLRGGLIRQVAKQRAQYGAAPMPD